MPTEVALQPINCPRKKSDAGLVGIAVAITVGKAVGCVCGVLVAGNEVGVGNGPGTVAEFAVGTLASEPVGWQIS